MTAKSKDTTKTAHVMNLLRKNSPPSAAQEEQPSAEPQPSSVPEEKPVAAKHPIIASLNEEAAVAQTIKGALEQELEAAEPQKPETPQPVSQPEPSAPVFEAFDGDEEEAAVPEAPEEPEEAEPAVEPEPEPVSEPALAPASAPEPVSEPPVVEEKESFQSYNVMQVLVDADVDKWMKMSKMCCCPRCRADVMAIALNDLQPKYVVMESLEYVPRITLYERQYASAVTAQILRACDIVAEAPHHDRS